MTNKVDRYISISRFQSDHHTITIPIYDPPRVTPCAKSPRHPIPIKEAEYKKQQDFNMSTLEKMAVWELSAVTPGIEINENEPVWENV